ncbi:MAG: hypothetical protein GOP50_05100 [Candidatus Heimdallarchaeota archaeon]|nr:hypothetical protein [Candidatus Heimdallarchaeota archaeon]
MTKDKPNIIPPEEKIPSRGYRIKIKESIRRRLAEEENFYAIELDDFEEVEYKPYSTEENIEEKLPPVKFVIDKYYLQRIKDDPSRVLVTLYLDYGYLKPNRVKEIVEVNKKKPFLSKLKGKCLIRLFNDDLCELALIPMKHSSSFNYHPISSQPQLFLGLIENLEHKKDYHYRIECYDENDILVGSSKVIEFVAAVEDTKQPIFFVSTSDLHGGHKARFKRGKGKGCGVRTNPILNKLMNDIHVNEMEYTFNKGYQVFTTSGDNIDNGSYHQHWADLFTCANPNLARIVFSPTIGNHDYFNGGFCKGAWFGGANRTQKHFHIYVQTPGKHTGAFYSHTEGNVFMIHLDSVGLTWGNESITCDSRQWEWLNRELSMWRRRANEGIGPQFCYVFLHSAIFTIGYFGRARNNSDSVAQSCLTPLFDEYGVSAAVFGHDHMYQRSLWKSTEYLCIGVSGKGPINYFDNLRNKTDYKIEKDEEGEEARGYGVTYVPPNHRIMSEDEKIRFDEWLFTVKQQILNDDIRKYYLFITEDDQEDYKELMVDPEEKEQFIDEKIIPKLKTCIWWRFYNTKGKLVDQSFMEPVEREIRDESFITCPNLHIR